MKVVIDISKNDYELACRYPDALIAVYAHAIKNGEPLPDGAEILTKEAYSDLCMSAAEQLEKRTEERTETHACDCISRQAAIQAVTHFDDTLKRLYELPSVEPERKTGKWEYVQYDGNPKIGNWHCSECRSIVLGFEYTGFYNYCPWCGAPMEEDLV